MKIISKLTELLVGKPKESNKMYKTIHPYKKDYNCWVFDDQETGLEEEGLVDGIDTMLDEVCNKLNILPAYGLDVHFTNHPDAYEDTPYKTKITLQLQSECPGGWKNAGAIYKIASSAAYYPDRHNLNPMTARPLINEGRQGWLCANLAKYFGELPQTIYISFQEDVIVELTQAAQQRGYDIQISDDYYIYDAGKDAIINFSERESYKIMQGFSEFPKWKLQNVYLADIQTSQEKWIQDILKKAPNLNKEKIHLTIQSPTTHIHPEPKPHIRALLIHKD